MSQYFSNAYRYEEYKQLQSLKRDFPKRCAKETPSNIPCEYYTMPRTINLPPAGYTPYTTHQIYDVNNAGDLVRVSIRVRELLGN